MTLPPKITGEDNHLAKAYASIILTGDSNPAFWTEYFGADPDMLVVRGELFRTPSGRMSTQPGRIGIWDCKSQSSIRSDTLDQHIQYLISLLGFPRTDLPKLLAQHETSMRLLCYWFSEDESDVPIIDIKLQELVTESGGTIDIDCYPKRDSGGDAGGS